MDAESVRFGKRHGLMQKAVVIKIYRMDFTDYVDSSVSGAFPFFYKTFRLRKGIFRNARSILPAVMQYRNAQDRLQAGFQNGLCDRFKRFIHIGKGDCSGTNHFELSKQRTIIYAPGGQFSLARNNFVKQPLLQGQIASDIPQQRHRAMRMRIDQSGQNQFISSLYYVDLIVVLAKEGIDFGFVICHSPDPAAVDTESLISRNTVFGIN